MRFRFLPAEDASRGPIQTLDFVYLPLPQLQQPPDNPSFSAVFLRSVNEIPVLDISPEIQKLPIDDALSIFLSDVLPHFIDVAHHEERNSTDCSKENPEIVPVKRSSEICYGKKQVVSFGYDKQEIQDGATSTTEDQNGNQFVQFEIPEMDISLLSPNFFFHSHKESLQIFSEISEAECTMDLLSSELKVHNHLEIQQSVYSVDDMSMEYSMDKKVNLSEDACSVQGKVLSHNTEFPLFEVDEETIGIAGNKYMVDELLHFENIEIQQLAQPDEMISNNKEVLGSVEFDLIKDLLHHNDAKKCLEDTDYSSQLDYISVVDLSNIQEYSVFQCEKPEDDSIWSTYPIFNEYMFFDLDPYTFHEVFSDVAKEIEAETCESMFGETMNFRSFGELIVCHELTLMDDSFKSLPVPILPDHGHTRSLHSMIEELLTQVDWQSSSASDGLYLDWHYLTEDGCDMVNYSSCWKMLGEIETYNTDAALNLSDNGKLIFDYILSEDLIKLNAENDKEILDLPSSDVSILQTSSGKADSTSLSNHGDQKVINEESLLKSSVEKVPLFGESMSSDLDYFLNSRNYVTGRENMPADKSVKSKTMCQELMASDDNTDAYTTTVVQQKRDVQLHQVKLSDNILLLIDFLSKHFLALLEKEKELIQMENQYQAANDFTSLHIPKEKLMSRLKEKLMSCTYYAQSDDDVMVLTMLCAIKQMAFYLCYYGVQATYLYLDKLSTNLQFVKSRFSYLYNLIRDEYDKAEKELNIIHPSIPIVREILQSNLSNSSSKILMISDRVFWWPLKRLMTSLKITYNEPQHFSTHASPQHNCSEITDTTMDMMLCSDCCLVSHDYVSASFPFSKFSFILEYGGSDESSRIASIFPKLDGFPTLHFLKVELEDLSIAKAFSDGVGMPKSIELKKDPGSTCVQIKSKLEELLNTIPVKEAYDNGPVKAVNEAEACSKMPFQAMPVSSESRQNLPCKSFCSDTVIIVNTRNFNEEMVISRRSTYQRVLGMEKEGAQIVERDISLPVDLIVSAAVSLTWYNCRNIGKKASAPDEAFSCLPLCVESIAASILTSLSFAFNCCILIFEGEGSFLGSVMESSDEIYAAAASLGIEIQLFFSYSSEMTEEIILSCINFAAKLSRGLYPKLSESESLAESFLTAFPSINPLSAHAILSSENILGKFLELSNEGKISALKKYQVPDESVALLSATSKYGEREDCKSGLTDHSSSVSSVPDSGNVQFKSASEMKRLKYTHDLYNDVEPPNDLFHMEPLDPLPDDILNPPRPSVYCNSWLSGSAEISNKPSQLNSSSTDKLFSFEEFDANCWRSDPETTNDHSRQSINIPGIPRDKFIGEVIDVDDTPAFKECFSPFLLDEEKDYMARNSRTSGLSLGANITNPINIDSACDAWISRRDTVQVRKEETKPRFATIDRKNTPMNHQRGLMEVDMLQKAPQNSYNPSFQQMYTRNSSGTPLSNALHSTQMKQGSPWTIEFLNRIKEKSRLRQQSIPRNLSSSPCFNFSENTSRATKRKSPSIFEFYKYEGGSNNTPKKIVDQKRLKRTSQSLNSLKNNEKAAASNVPPWTPIDKRARRKLSFSTNGNGGQSKLVWGDNNNNNLRTSQRRF